MNVEMAVHEIVQCVLFDGRMIRTVEVDAEVPAIEVTLGPWGAHYGRVNEGSVKDRDFG